MINYNNLLKNFVLKQNHVIIDCIIVITRKKVQINSVITLFLQCVSMGRSTCTNSKYLPYLTQKSVKTFIMNFRFSKI